LKLGPVEARALSVQPSRKKAGRTVGVMRPHPSPSRESSKNYITTNQGITAVESFTFDISSKEVALTSSMPCPKIMGSFFLHLKERKRFIEERVFSL
jgi:hypothetical protein